MGEGSGMERWRCVSHALASISATGTQLSRIGFSRFDGQGRSVVGILVLREYHIQIYTLIVDFCV